MSGESPSDGSSSSSSRGAPSARARSPPSAAGRRKARRPARRASPVSAGKSRTSRDRATRRALPAASGCSSPARGSRARVMPVKSRRPSGTTAIPSAKNRCGGKAREVAAVKRHRAGRDRMQAGDRVDERDLARAVRADDAHELAGGNVEGTRRRSARGAVGRPATLRHLKHARVPRNAVTTSGSSHHRRRGALRRCTTPWSSTTRRSDNAQHGAHHVLDEARSWRPGRESRGSARRRRRSRPA